MVHILNRKYQPFKEKKKEEKMHQARKDLRTLGIRYPDYSVLVYLRGFYMVS